MYPTAEIRWFYQGPIPPEVQSWFRGERSARLPPPEEQPARVDRYLHIPEGDSLGIKLRGGDPPPRIEIKQRVPDSRFNAQSVQLHPRVTGVTEHWRKWSLPLAEADGEPAPATSWIPVKKARWMHTFHVRGEEIVCVERNAESISAPGCELELSTVNAVDQTWWTLCFEAFGKGANDQPSELYKTLLRVAEHVFTTYGSALPITLDAQASYGYARWLAHILQ